MLKILKDNFEIGIERIKWFASVIAERIKIELLVIKLLFQSYQMEKKRDELLKKIGRRVYEMRENPDKDILKDRFIIDSLKEIERIDSEIELTKKKASEISNSI